ncbi:PAS domain S-box-containing protein [Sphingobium sp. B1D7B]|uniref:hybrid sensor histidine kinase/response regulator n=1 Tax=Sphingobium sp. B11D3A TaxID=2940574 RepID=UPI0022242EB8|nr:PAS domain-containing sensor histidine kinase [Sphingobium sp. B11D3A]MCW2393504.1 PAS domain S-box-containing protein [Sphingobium sp. B11D3A]MCW2405442.1 PAS domain S-box-containing protein [Sphingobium sp. B1D7B]
MQASEDLRAASLESYRQLVESITDYAMCMLDRTGHITNWNAGAQKLKGFQPEDIIGVHFSRFYTAEDVEKGMPERALEIAATQGKHESEGWRLRKDGSRFWAHVVIDPVRDAHGALIGYAGITRDLTERKLAEQALRKSEEQFALLVQSVTDYAIYMLDPEGMVSSWNAGAERIKGYRKDEVLGQHFSQFYQEEDRTAGEPQRALETARSEGRFTAEGWRVRKGGERFRASVVIEALRDETGALVGFAKITRDVTEREAAQRALDEAREALGQAQKMEALGQLTGGVAHDFNNLLMAINSSLILLRRRIPEQAETQRLLDNAMQAVDRGATLTQRMLAFARRQELSIGRVHIPELLRGMTELVQRTIGPEWPVSMIIPLGLQAVKADANQLEMAILNLAVNARDAMPDGGAIIIKANRQTVRSNEISDLEAGHYVVLTVVDSGIGMDAETLRRATEPFFTTKGVGKGTGLGLPMIHGFARQIGGAFTLTSAPGKGTSAQLWLPQAAEQSQATTPAAKEPPLPPQAKCRVLAVDDDALVLMNTVALLEDLGHEVVSAVNGAHALSKFKDGGFDLVITDQAMPGMTGTDLAAAITAVQSDMPIIIASGYGEGLVLPEGQIHRLSKPFGEHQLAKAIYQACCREDRPTPAV